MFEGQLGLGDRGFRAAQGREHVELTRYDECKASWLSHQGLPR